MEKFTPLAKKFTLPPALTALTNFISASTYDRDGPSNFDNDSALVPDPEECLSGHSVQGQSSWVASTRVSAKNQTLLFYECLLKDDLVNPGLAARIHHYTGSFIPLHPPTPLVCDTKQWGSVGNFLTLICCIIDHPSPPLSFRPSKVEYPDPKFCPVLSRLIGYAVNCLYC